MQRLFLRLTRHFARSIAPTLLTRALGVALGNTARQKAQVCALLQFMDAYPVDRLYYYQYWEPDAAQTWDTGLAGQSPTDPWHSIGPVRLAYNVIQQRHC